MSTIPALREQLRSRHLSTCGTRQQLAARLSHALELEAPSNRRKATRAATQQHRSKSLFGAARSGAAANQQPPKGGTTRSEPAPPACQLSVSVSSRKPLLSWDLAIMICHVDSPVQGKRCRAAYSTSPSPAKRTHRGRKGARPKAVRFSNSARQAEPRRRPSGPPERQSLLRRSPQRLRSCWRQLIQRQRWTRQTRVSCRWPRS